MVTAAALPGMTPDATALANVTQDSKPPREAAAWAVLHAVLDPEVPALSVCDLGIARAVVDHGEMLEIVLTPTYSGCPATEVIECDVLRAVETAGLGPARVSWQRAPAWSSDWISAEGRRKLALAGIAAPGALVAGDDARGWQGVAVQFIGRRREAVACPRCNSLLTEQLSAFGTTACKSLYRCTSCREPFEYFKPI